MLPLAPPLPVVGPYKLALFRISFPETDKLLPDNKRSVVPEGEPANLKFAVNPISFKDPPIPDKLITGLLTGRLKVTTISPK